MMSDIWTQAAAGGDEQVKWELLEDAEKIERFIIQTLKLDDDFRLGILRGGDWLLERLTLELYQLDGNYPFPEWVKDWYLKACAWKVAGHVPPFAEEDAEEKDQPGPGVS